MERHKLHGGNKKIFPTYLVDPNRFAEEFYHVHDLDGVVRIIFSHEFHKSVPLMGLSDPVTWHMDVYCRERGGGEITFY